MREYFIRRVLIVIPTIFFATLLVFFLIRLTPGDVIDMMVSQNDVSADEVTREKIEQALGLDVPVYIQYFQWMKNLFLHADLGESLWMGTKVTDEIISRLPITFELGIIAIIVGLSIAFPIGIYSAVRQDTIGDYVGRTFAILGLAIPGFWLGTMVVILPAVWWDWSPPLEYIPITEDPIANLKMLLIPGVILGMSLSAVTMRMTRTMMLEVLRQDYIRTAWAKGQREVVVVYKHALKNALIPVVTLIGLQLPILIGGTVIIEQIFVLPGMGLLMLESINQRDYPLITGLMLVIGLVVLIINLIVDISYGFFNPKVRYK
ncbi:MAG: ABC transporter permease [Deltaproteobacteria bacterium]|nr:ABC transporter permease [Deltaproteobacteria bacterium]MBW2051111.1 ABC transporter permease [Deltaproteobacteria bacterium]MBW2141393.1 ABC transporter permease [Deltaproteobacteria bacterium]MBW2324152.1 ABC transporter permease [Deltaproteobacteria bacterium]